MSDLYDGLVKDLRYLAKVYSVCENENTQEYKLAVKAADAIEELSKPKWIPVTERLPEREKKMYWVCTDRGYQCECRWTNNQFGIRESDEWGWNIFDIPQYQKVVAWMSLPDPYEPPKEET